MKKVKKMIALLLSLVMVFSLVACGSSDTPSSSNTPSSSTPSTDTDNSGDSSGEYVWPENPEKVYTLTVANAVTKDTQSGQALLKVKEELEKRSNGAVTLDIFWESVIGSANEQAEAVATGTLDIAVLSAAVLSQYATNINVMSLPFIITDREQAKAVLDQCFDDVTAGIEDTLGKPLGIWDLGFRYLETTEKEIKTLDDVAGLSIRVMDGKIYSDVWNALGAIPQNINASEIVTALQQGVVDGVEAPLTMVYNQQHYTFCKYIAMVAWNLSVACPVLSNVTAAKLPQEVLDLIDEVFYDCRYISFELGQQYDDQFLQVCVDNNMTINYLDEAELSRFVNAVSPIWDQYEDTLGADLIEKVSTAK